MVFMGVYVSLSVTRPHVRHWSSVVVTEFRETVGTHFPLYFSLQPVGMMHGGCWFMYMYMYVYIYRCFLNQPTRIYM